MIIYKIVNAVTRKIYIGQTVKTLAKRWAQHKHKGLKISRHKNPFHASIAHHGPSAFIVDVVDSTATTKDELNELEIKYIAQFNSVWPNGYNLATGGYSNSGGVAWNRGQKSSVETRRKLSEAHKGQIPGNRKSVLCLNNKTIYASLHEAAAVLNLNVSKISLVISGARKHTEGYSFSVDLSAVSNPKQYKNKLKNIKPRKLRQQSKVILSVNPSRPTCYFLVGAFGSGKTWIADQISTLEVLSHDKHGAKIAVETMLADHSKVYLYESPVHVSSFIKKHKHELDIRTIVVQEDLPTIKRRLEERSLRPISPDKDAKILKKIHRMGVIAKKPRYNPVFTGTSQECLNYLKSI
jgi:group I intron endonuclease